MAKNVRTHEHKGKLYAVLVMDPVTAQTEHPCPFCGNRHAHGVPDRGKLEHRVAHCPDKEKHEITVTKGCKVRAADGYFITW